MSNAMSTQPLISEQEYAGRVLPVFAGSESELHGGPDPQDRAQTSTVHPNGDSCLRPVPLQIRERPRRRWFRIGVSSNASYISLYVVGKANSHPAERYKDA